MKTVEQIQSLIEYNAKEMTKKNPDGSLIYRKSKIKNFTKKIQLLRQYKFYLESNPSKEYLRKAQDDAYNHINSIDNNFAMWLENQTIKPNNPLNAYRKAMNRNFYVTQARTMDFLLEEKRK